MAKTASCHILIMVALLILVRARISLRVSCQIKTGSSKGLILDHANFTCSIRFFDHSNILRMRVLMMENLLSHQIMVLGIAVCDRS